MVLLDAIFKIEKEKRNRWKFEENSGKSKSKSSVGTSASSVHENGLKAVVKVLKVVFKTGPPMFLMAHVVRSKP